MNTLTIQTALPMSAKQLFAASRAVTPSAQWWPGLFLKKGRKLIQIQPEQCGPLMRAFVGDRGASEMRRPWIDLHDRSGERVGRITYNGRVWLHDIEGDVEVPTVENA